MPYFRKYRKIYLTGLVTVMLSTVFAVIVPAIIRIAIDGLQNNVSTGQIAQYAVLVVAISAVSGIFLYLTRQTIIVGSRLIENDMRNDFIAHIQRLSMRYFQNTPTGDIIAHSTNDISAVRMFLGPAVMYSAETIFTFTIVLVLLLRINTVLTLITLIPMPLISVVVNKLGTLIHKRYEEIQSHFSILTTRAQESFAGVRVVKSYRREQHEHDLFKDLSEEYLAKNMKVVRLQSLMMPLMSILIGASIILVLWQGGMRVIWHVMTLGELTQFIIYLGILIWPMIAIGWVIAIIQRAAASMQRLKKVMDAQPEIADTAETDRSVTSINGAIRFSGVAFTYGSGMPAVLRGVDLDIPAGSTLAIVGYVGTGKTTLVNLLPRMYDVTGGCITIDGIDVKRIPVNILRRSIAYVTQETFLFSDTIAANIGYSDGCGDMKAVMEAAEAAQVACDIEEFPMKYDTVLGERGITLSGGQKQRISLARALYRKPAILILDDALSAVDTNTEERILVNLKSILSLRTSIIISHRISTVKDADMIIVLQDGLIHESGTHTELVELGGIYADLHRKQQLTRELEEIE
jgi:ATP-binding cassette subfamily B protein